MFDAIPVTHETWLVCGGRNFVDADCVDSVLSGLSRKYGVPWRIVHGASRGADTLASEWGRRMAIDVIAVPADWNVHGKSAGPIRNQKMLDEYEPSLVIAFPGGRGTTDMVTRAKSTAGISTVEIKANPLHQEKEG